MPAIEDAGTAHWPPACPPASVKPTNLVTPPPLPQCFWLFLIFYGMPAKLDRFKIPSQCSWFTNPTEYDFYGMPAGYCCNPDPAATVNNCNSSAYLTSSAWDAWQGWEVPTPYRAHYSTVQLLCSLHKPLYPTSHLRFTSRLEKPCPRFLQRAACSPGARWTPAVTAHSRSPTRRPSAAPTPRASRALAPCSRSGITCVRTF